jgi:hypothetical protein
MVILGISGHFFTFSNIGGFVLGNILCGLEGNIE